MLLALLVRRLAMPHAPIAVTRALKRLKSPPAPGERVRDIAGTISAHGPGALTKSEHMIWNTAVVIYLMTGDDRMIALHDEARVHSWSAARAGFREMGLPALADFVKSLVFELAYRADLDASDRAAESASLRRIADLKRDFQAVATEVDLAAGLGQLIARLDGQPAYRDRGQGAR